VHVHRNKPTEQRSDSPAKPETRTMVKIATTAPAHQITTGLRQDHSKQNKDQQHFVHLVCSVKYQ
jgi:hypothetical protein